MGPDEGGRTAWARAPVPNIDIYAWLAYQEWVKSSGRVALLQA